MIPESLKQYKFFYRLYNFFKRKQLMHNVETYRKYNIRKKYYSSVSSEDFRGIPFERNYLEVKNSRTELPGQKAFQELAPGIRDALLGWSDKGYAVLKGFFPEAECDHFVKTVEQLNEQGKANWKYRNKIMFAIHESETLWNAGGTGQLKAILDMLMGKEVILFQSINFFTASEQRTHSDAIHMTTFPEGNLIAAWIALEDMTPGNGPLHYYPGSHKLPYVMNRDFNNVGTSSKLGDKTYEDYEDKIQEIVEAQNLEKEIFMAKKGDVLIWHGNLLHGGEPVTEPDSTRKSMVFHYYTKGAVCYHEITQRPALLK